jgi:nucleoside-diphosphate-sugar epimerase
MGGLTSGSVCILGRHGFLGSALAARLGKVTSVPTPETRVLFHLASHTHPAFELNPEFEMKQVIDSFTQLLPWCYENGVLFVYPSSALVYEKETQFSRFKQTLESLVKCYKTATLGLRIYPAYGPGEERTVISQWCRQMAAGIRPTVYGDGNQSRDFIFIDDVVDQIRQLVSEGNFTSRVVDIGTGVRTSFNEIVQTINEELGTNLQPEYARKPTGYSDGIVCPSPLPVKVSVRQGIRKILETIMRPIHV